jgi:uroporphyrinogen decarboxylase
MIGRVRDLLTLEGLAYATYDYPEMVEDMVETSCVLVEDFLDHVLPAFDFDYASGWEDICYNRGPLVSLDFFEHVVVPRYQRISAKLRQYKVDIYFTDCDGDLRPILPLLLKGGLNTLFPFEVNGNGNPVELLEKYQGQVRILGGVDKMVMAQGPGPIRAYLEKLRPWVEKGGFIPHCDHRCPPNVSQPDYLAYLDIKEELFGMH